METSPKKKYLGVFQLIMIAVVSVDSLRNLPIGAQYGLSLVTLYAFAGLAFFLPLAWTTSQLAVRFPKIGGSYVWVEAAFGKSLGYLSIWLQWTYNIIWYPTIFAFISSTILALLAPGMESNRWLILLICTSMFWLITFAHSFGLRATSWISAVSAIIGTLVPMSLMIAFAGYWLWSGAPSATPLSWHGLVPGSETFNNMAYFSNILFSLLGLEVIAMHAGNVKDPQTSYPRAVMSGAIIILSTLMLSSLALCIVIPPGKIVLLSGIMDVFNLFFASYHFPLGASVIGWCIVLGGVGIASSWMIGLARGLHVALASARLFKPLLKLNKNGVPMNVLYFQGITYSVLLSAFVLMPNVNNSYWLLSALSAQFALLYYVLLFAAAIKLLSSVPQSRFNASLKYFLPASGGVISLIGVMVGFIPPSNVNASDVFQYEMFMVISLIAFCIIPLMVLRRRHAKLSLLDESGLSSDFVEPAQLETENI